LNGMPLYKLKKAWRYLKHFGWKEFWNHVRDRMEPEDVPYGPWRTEHLPSEQELKKQRETSFADGPLISILVPAYRTPEKFLDEMISSVTAQTYGRWELCIADASDDSSVENAVLPYTRKDRRIRCRKLDRNGGISANTNEAEKMAAGSYLAFLDHDDLIAPESLFEAARAILEKKADFLYSDEDKVSADLTKYYQPHFKPDFNPDLLRSNNYITHFLIMKKTLFEEVGGLDDRFDGAQDYDLILRAAEKAEKIVHIPKVLYHWRTHEASTADNPMSKVYAYEAGKKAIEDSLKRLGFSGTAEILKDYGFYRVHYQLTSEPLVSVIIPNRDHTDILKKCLDALRNASYKKIEIIIVENGSTEEATRRFYEELKKEGNVRIAVYDGGFNYSAINNLGVRSAAGEYLLFLNNDVYGTISPDWISEMLSVCERPDVGAVGAKLYYPDDTIQHAGCVIGIGGIAANMFAGLPRSRSGYMHKASLMQDLTAVTAACMLMKRKTFEDAGGFTEELAVAFNDIDLCLKAGRKGWRIVYDPYAELYHDESKSRGAEDTEEKVRRFQSEIEYMRTHWTDILKNGDPNYNPNLSVKKWNYSLRAR
jgi:GT2 family glycosyltransferase